MRITKLTQVLLTLLLTVAVILILPIPLIFFIFPLIVYRWTISKLYTCITGDRTSAGILPLESAVYATLVRGGKPSSSSSSSSSSWVHSNENKVIILLNVTVEGSTLDIGSFQALVGRELISARGRNGHLLYPELQQYPCAWMGHLFWKLDTSFAIENHVKLYQNKEDWVTRDSEFCQKFMREYIKTTLPHNRSPWEMTVIENVRESIHSDPSTVILFKFTHYLADGQSIFTAIRRLADGGAENVKRHESKLPSKFQILCDCITYPVMGTYAFVSDLISSSSKSKDDWNWSRSVNNGDELPVATRSMARSSQLNFDILRSRAKEFKVAVTPVLLLGVGHGTRRFMEKCGNFKPEEIPTHLKCVLPLQASSRAYKMANNMNLARLDIPMEYNNIDFEEQLHEFAKEMARIKVVTVPPFWKLLHLLLTTIPSTWALKHTLIASASLHIDNFLSIFPGPKKEFKVLGKRVLGMHYVTFGIVSRFPFHLALLTYNGTLQFWITAGSEFASQEQIGNLAACLEQEFVCLYRSGYKVNARGVSF